MNKKRIILASIIGIIALNTVSLTLAWYASSSKLNIDSIIVTIDADRELKISTSDNIDSFKDELTYDDFNHVPVFIPVSSMFCSEWINEKASKPIFYDSSSMMVQTSGEPFLRTTSFGFLNQDIYILCDDDVYVTIDNDVNNTFINPNSFFNNAYAQDIRAQYPELTYEEIVDRLDRLSKAMRFSLLYQNEEEDEYSYVIIDPEKDENNEEVLMGGILDNSISREYDYYYDYNEHSFCEVVYGEVYNRDKIVYDEALDSDSELVGEANAFNAKHKAGVKRFNQEKSLENGFEIATENSTGLSSFDYDFVNNKKPSFYFPVKRNTPTKLNLSIYLEGWDIASVNHTMGASFLAGLSFKIYREI